MVLKNFWWLLIWIFLGGAIFGNVPKRRELVCGKIEERWEPLAAFLLVLPYILWAGFTRYGDTWLYMGSFQSASSNLADIPALFAADIKDPGYKAFEIVFKFLFGEQVNLFFLVIAAFQMLCMLRVFRKYSDDFWTSIFLFVASCWYIGWMLNGIRQFIAVTMVFACFDWMLEKKYLPLILVILVASWFHNSVLFMLPVIFVVQGKAWDIKTILALAATFTVVFFIDDFLPVMQELLEDTQYDGALDDELDDGVNAIRVLVESIPALLSLLGLRYVRQENNPVINLCVNYSIVTTAMFLIGMVTSGIFVGRMPIYTLLYGYIAMPWLIDHIFEPGSARLVKYAMVGMYCLYFAYQT